MINRKNTTIFLQRQEIFPLFKILSNSNRLTENLSLIRRSLEVKTQSTGSFSTRDVLYLQGLKGKDLSSKE
jgi:hypothetical protein